MNLNLFNTTSLFEAATNLFEQLGIKLNSNTAKALPTKDLLKNFYKDNEVFNSIKSTYFIGIIDDSVFQTTGMFDVNYSIKEALQQGDKNYDGLMLFALELIKKPTRTEISEITRAFNRISQKMPVALVLKYAIENESVISIAISERFKYLQNWQQGEKAGKVIILRDIFTSNTHAGHQRILLDLVKPTGVINFTQLHKCWLEVLDVNLLNKKFYQDLFKWYLWAKDHSTFPNDNSEEADKYLSESLIRFISRLLFVWFMKEKKLITNDIFNKKQLSLILKNFDTKSTKNTYYKAILQNLFFATLDVPIADRKWIDGKKKNKAQLGDPLIYRFESEFANSDNVIEHIFMQIPFLNGGLFDCLDQREHHIFVDGFTKNEKKQAQLPNYLFFDEHTNIDLSHHFADEPKEKNKWKNQSLVGIIDLLHNYKFTIEENTPLEVDVALDPELLGKVFENLLASFNPETKTTARKQTGSFYTPREIVNYMVDESLKQYLITQLPENNADIEHLFQSNVSSFSDTLKKQTVKKLFECKILDPACGSGAFPMGVLHKMVELMTLLDPHTQYLKEIEGKKIDFLIQNANSLADTHFRNQTIEVLQKQKEILHNSEYDYIRKLYIIENCIHGIDIQPIAIQISKLRFFISLLVEQNKNAEHENFGIYALPNMDFKLVAANTLIAPPHEDKGIGLFAEQNEFFDQFDKLTHDYFTLYTPESKKQKKNEIIQLINSKVNEKLTQINRNKELHKKTEELEQSKKLWQSYPNMFKEKSVDFFDVPYFFPKVKDGFDIVIGNPPYVDSETMTKDNPEFREYLKSKFQSAEGNWDLFVVFTEMGLKLCKGFGNLAFIIPNKIISAKYSYSLRTIICKLSPREVIDYSYVNVFKEADVYPVVILISNQETYKYQVSSKVMYNLEEVQTKNLIDSIQFTSDIFWDKYFFNPDVVNLIIKITNNAKLIRKFPNILGAATVNEAYQIKEVIRELGKEKKYFKFINTGTIDPYKSIWGLKRTQYIKGNYHKPIITKNDLDEINITRTSQSSSPKIIIAGMAIRIEAFFDETGSFCAGKSTTIILGETQDLKTLTGIINSKLVSYWFSKYFNSLSMAGGYFNIGNNEIGLIPLPEVDFQNNQIIKLVDKILSVKSGNSESDTSKLEKQIDEMVYKLYDLTEEEIAIIENSNKKI